GSPMGDLFFCGSRIGGLFSRGGFTGGFFGSFGERKITISISVRPIQEPIEKGKVSLSGSRKQLENADFTCGVYFLARRSTPRWEANSEHPIRHQRMMSKQHVLQSLLGG